MWGFSGRGWAIAVASVLGAAVASAAVAIPEPSDAARVPRPDLIVSKGAVSASKGNLSGSFVVQNASRVRAAGRSSATLTVRSSGKSRVVKRFKVPALSRSASRTVKVAAEVPAGLPAGSLTLRVCADGRGEVRERSESNNCRTVGKLKITDTGSVQPNPTTPGPPPTPKPNLTPGPSTPASSVPTDPVPFTKNSVFTLSSPQSDYWIYVPTSYDQTHATPTTLFVWLHGCGGQSSGDIETVSPGGDQNYISIAVGGREGDCWDVNSDPAKVLVAIANVKTHFNINPRRVILGGYSSGGDLAYRTAFYNANTFAGVLAENTSPFRDTGSSQSASLAAAAWKFNVVHLAHTGDDAYPIAGVRDETNAMAAAGFPITRIERPGGHYDPDTGSTGTDYDLRTILLPHLTDAWLAP